MTKEELITAVEQLYGKDRFDFSLVPDEFIERTHRVTIICKIHNEKFNASLKELLNGYIGCKSCNTFGANYHMHKITQKYKLKLNFSAFCAFCLASVYLPVIFSSRSRGQAGFPVRGRMPLRLNGQKRKDSISHEKTTR